MKKIFSYVCIASGMIAMLASCQKEEVSVPESGTVNMIITASQDNDTKTTLGSDGKVKWNTTGELLNVYQISNKVGTTPITTMVESSEGTTTDEGMTMNFNVSFSSATADSFDYLAIYPSSSVVKSNNDDPAKLKVELANAQTPTSASFDNSKDILVAQAQTGLTSQPSELNLSFKRMTSVGKMTITNLSSAENVKTVTFKAAGKTLTGRSYLNLSSGKVVEYGYYGAEDNVVLDYSGENIAANGMTAYFCVWPCTIKDGDEITVTVKTETKTFTKNFKASKELSFTEGGLSKFSVDFTDIIADEDSPIKNGSISFGKGKVVIDKASVSFSDNLSNSWTVTTKGTTSFTTNNAAYIQIGSGSKPASSITFVGTLPASKNVTAVSAKFGGFNNTAGSISIKVGETEVGSGDLDGANDVTVSSSSSATGSTITITVTGIAKGVKVYSIDYTYTD